MDKIFTEEFPNGDIESTKNFVEDIINEAERKNNIEIIKFFLECDDEEEYYDDVRKKFKLRCLKNACKNGNFKLVKILIENFNMGKSYRRFDTLDEFYDACENGHIEIVDYLIEKYDVCDGITSCEHITKDDDYYLEHFKKARESRYDDIRFVYEYDEYDEYDSDGYEIKIEIVNGYHALKYILKGDQLEMFKFFMEGYDYISIMNTKSIFRNDLFHYYIKSPLVLEYLIEKGLDISILDFQSLLQNCFINKRNDFLKYLLENHNIDLNDNFKDLVGCWWGKPAKRFEYVLLV